MASHRISHMLKCVGIMLTVAFLFIPLSSCMEQSELPFDPLDITDETKELPFQYYRIVIPESCSASLYHSANELASHIQKATGMESAVIYEGSSDGRTAHVFEILLGNVNRAITKELFRDLRENDYLCRRIEDTLILGGISDHATISSIHQFYSDILPLATSVVLVAPDGGFFYQHDYSVPAMTLNGIPLNEYSIIYPEDASDRMIRLANDLCRRIQEQTSHSLSVISLSDPAFHGKGIFLSVSATDTEQSSAFIRPTDTGIFLCGEDLLSVSAAVRDFCELLISFSKNGENCRIEQIQTCSYSVSSYRIATVAGDHCFPLCSADDIVRILSPMANTYQADLVIFSPKSSGQPSYIASIFESNNYTVSEVGASQVICRKEGIRTENDIYSSTQNLTVSSFLMDGEKNGFWLVCITGSLEESTSLSLPESIQRSSLPVLILSHLRSAEGAELTLLDGGKNLLLTDSHTYVQSGCRYTVSCYCSNGMFTAEESNTDDSLGYREFSVKRSCLFPY